MISKEKAQALAQKYGSNPAVASSVSTGGRPTYDPAQKSKELADAWAGYDKSKTETKKTDSGIVAQMKSVNPWEMGKGALKGVASTALSIGQLGSKALETGYNATIGKITGKKAAGGAALAEQVKESDLMKRKNLGQKLGFGAEQFAEFFIPVGGEVSALSKIPGAAEKLAMLAEKSPKLAKALEIGLKTIREGTELAGKTALQEGDLENAPTNFALGAGGKVLGELAPLAVKPLKEAAVKQYGRALNATTKENKAISQQIVPQLLEKKVMAPSLSKLEAKAEAGAEKAGQKIEEITDAMPKDTPVKVSNVIDDLEREKAQYRVAGKGGKQVDVNPEAIANIEGFQKILKQVGAEDAPFESVRKLRQIWDQGVKEAKGFHGKTLSEGSKIQVQKTAADSIRAELGREFPNLDKLNKEYSFWKNVNQVVSDTVERRMGQQAPLRETLKRSAGVIAGSAMGGVPGALIGDFALGALTKMIDSTAWRTVSAVQKNQLADWLAKGQGEKIFEWLSKFATSQRE